MVRLKVAVLISGSGTNLQALIDACSDKSYPAKIVLVISNKADAFGLERARKAGIATKVISHKNFSSREEFDKEMDKSINESGAEFICMAGFMRLLSEWFVDKWHNRLVNIHPSLLPAFKGIDAQQQALDYGVKISGCTVHFVRKEMDVGPIIAQESVPVFATDNFDALRDRILEKEHVAYPRALEMIALGKIKIDGERVIE